MQNDFLRQQQAAIERMKEMNAKSAFYLGKNQKDEPKSETKNTEKFISENKPFFSNFPENLLKDRDTALILGLLLILMSEKSDKMLLFALVYILL